MEKLLPNDKNITTVYVAIIIEGWVELMLQESINERIQGNMQNLISLLSVTFKHVHVPGTNWPFYRPTHNLQS
jgi:hypothetical protein